MKSEHRTHLVLIVALVACNIAVKWTLWTQPPQTFPDSLGYIAPAMRLLDGLGYGSQDNGYRTPTYPLFIAAILAPFPHPELSECREARVPACLGEVQHSPGGAANLRAIVVVQIILGLLTTVLAYAFVAQIAGNPWIAGLAALTYPIDLSTGYWEISILTDTLTTFLLTLAVFLTVVGGGRSRRRSVGGEDGERDPAKGASQLGGRGTFGGERSLQNDRSIRDDGSIRGAGAGRRWWVYLALGVTLGAMALVHSVFLLYAIVPATFLWWRNRPNPPSQIVVGFSWPYSAETSTTRRFATPFPLGKGLGVRSAVYGIALVLIIPAALVIGWSARNYWVDGYFTPSTIVGYNLTQMVGSFMEQAPVPYRDLAEIYIDYRSERVAARGSHSGTIFFAYRDMLNVRHTTWAGLSRLLTDMSLRMIAQNPRGYIQTVWESFLQFWKFGLGRQNSELPLSWDWVKWFLDTRVHQAWMVLFFLSPLGLLLMQYSRRVEIPGAIWIWFAIATVLYAALFSSAFNYGDNERYRTHVARLQYSAVILVAWYLSKTALTAWNSRKSKEPGSQVVERERAL